MTVTTSAPRTLAGAAKRRLAHVGGVRPGITASRYERSRERRRHERLCDACFSPIQRTMREGGDL